MLHIFDYPGSDICDERLASGIYLRFLLKLTSHSCVDLLIPSSPQFFHCMYIFGLYELSLAMIKNIVHYQEKIVHQYLDAFGVALCFLLSKVSVMCQE